MSHSASVPLDETSFPPHWGLRPDIPLRHELAEAETEAKRLQQELQEATQHKEPKEQDAELQAALAEAERNFEMTSQAFNERLRCIDAEKMAALSDMKISEAAAETSMNEARELQAKLKTCELALEQAGKQQRLRNEQQLKRLQRPRLQWKVGRSLHLNIAREMLAARTGATMEKLSEKGDKKQLRFVEVRDDMRLLRWCHPPGPANAKDKSLAVDSIVGIRYGMASKGAILFSAALPWRCFSLETLDRSYDFICQDDATVQSFVLVLSRLCARAEGAIRSRSQFLSRKGWCKVQAQCYQRKITLAYALREAIRIVAKENPADVGKPCRSDMNKSTGGIANPFTLKPNADDGAAGNPFTFVSDGAAGNPFTFVSDGAADNPFTFTEEDPD